MYIPEKWKNGLLGEMFEIKMGSSPNGSSINESKKGIPFFQGKVDFGQRFPSVRTYTTSPTKTAKELSVLLTVRAPVGDLNIALDRCCIGRGIASITSSARSYTFYTLNYLKPHFEYYNNFGTTFGSINKDDLYGIKTIISPKSVIEKFEEFVLPIDDVIRKLSFENRELEQLRDWLLPMLMNGQVTVDE